MLDSSYDDCDYEEGSSEPTFKWTKHNVDLLTEQWPKVQEIRGKMDNIVEWLEADPIGHFRELLDFLLKSKLKSRKRRKREYYNPFEHHCTLDQDDGEEEDDDQDDE